MASPVGTRASAARASDVTNSWVTAGCAKGGEPLSLRRVLQAVVEGHESAIRGGPGPLERRGELERIRGSKGVEPENPKRLLANAVARLDLEPARSEQIEERARRLFLRLGQLSVLVQSGDRGCAFDCRPPPDDQFRVLLQQLLGPLRPGLGQHERYQRRGVPEPHQPDSRSASRAASDRPSWSIGWAWSQKFFGNARAGERSRPVRSRRSRRLSSSRPPFTGASPGDQFAAVGDQDFVALPDNVEEGAEFGSEFGDRRGLNPMTTIVIANLIVQAVTSRGPSGRAGGAGIRPYTRPPEIDRRPSGSRTRFPGYSPGETQTNLGRHAGGHITKKLRMVGVKWGTTATCYSMVSVLSCFHDPHVP